MKSEIYKKVALLIFPIVFVALFLIVGGTEHQPTCWIGFGSTLLSYLAIVCIPRVVPSSKSTYLFTATGSTITGIFFIIQFIAGLVFMISDFEQWKIALIIEVVLFAIEGLIMLKLLQMDEVTAAKETKHNQEAYAVTTLVNRAKMICDSTSDMNIKKCVQNVCDELRTCHTSSNPQVKEIDDAISYGLDMLSQAVLAGDFNRVKSCSQTVIAKVKERKSF